MQKGIVKRTNLGFVMRDGGLVELRRIPVESRSGSYKEAKVLLWGNRSLGLETNPRVRDARTGPKSIGGGTAAGRRALTVGRAKLATGRQGSRLETKVKVRLSQARGTLGCLRA